MIALLLATRNRHKIMEIRGILGESFEYLTLDSFPDAPEVTEDAPSFAGNATKKAVELARWVAKTEQPKSAAFFVLADDSGLEVDVLDGAPGVHSARFASETRGNASNSENNLKLLRLLKDIPLEKRTARFRCVLALTPTRSPQPEPFSPVCYAEESELVTELFEGTCEGRIGLEPRGNEGFGYDPLFIPDGYDRTFAELGESTKNRLSHRGRALEQLEKRLRALK